MLYEAVQGMSTSREAVPVNCANARRWWADMREALEFIQGLGNEDLPGKEAQLVMLTRVHDDLVESCEEMGQKASRSHLGYNRSKEGTNGEESQGATDQAGA